MSAIRVAQHLSKSVPLKQARMNGHWSTSMFQACSRALDGMSEFVRGKSH